ncbi:AAA family ATPase [Paenibacillus frigoriresistens]|uniref:AAA family ATPase n=1 Tax=Paenibacillus alginolyticus TaxID=59839 RepID=UPI0015677D84|nr:AAA family ATPase [Paenibacillus frigoriresistens]NRF92802.1 AAA family ATPase [Paenibacillus frigoriresistens]
MRIVSMQVQGFGSLRERQLDTDSPLVLFYGANEAGKSTLMGFVRAVLFGFPTRQSRLERYEPLGGGAHGGALTLLDEQGQLIRVERYDAPAAGGRRASAGLVKVTLGDGTTGGEELLNTLLGGLSADLFRSLFAFGLTELQELRTLQTDELSGYLYSAGLGVSGSAIMEAERKLTAQADGLYRPRGRNQEMNRLLKELEGLEQSLRRSRDPAADYDRLLAERRSAEERIAALEGQQESLRAELHRLGLAGKARSGWIRLRQIGQELAVLPALAGFPEHASARLDALEAELERIHAERARLLLRQMSLTSQLHAIELVPDLLEHQLELNHWLEQAAAYEENKRSVDQLSVEHEHQRAQVDRLLKQIDVHWEETDLASFSVTISLREQVRAYKERFYKSKENELRVRTELESLQQQVKNVQDTVRSLEADLHKSGVRTDGSASHGWGGADPSSTLHQIARDYARWQLLVRELAHQKERAAVENQFQLSLEEAAKAGKTASRRLRQRFIVITGLLAVLTPLFLLWQGSWVTALCAFLLFAGTALYMLVSDRGANENRSSRAMTSSPIRDESVSEELRLLERRLQEQIQPFAQQQSGYGEAAAASAAHSLGRSAAMPLEVLQPQLDAWMREAEQNKQQRSEQLRKLEKLQDMKEMLQSLRHQEDQRSGYLGQLIVESDQLYSDWTYWLQSLGLSTPLSADALLETIQTIEQGQESLRQLQKLASKLETLVTSIDHFEKTVGSLLRISAAERQDPVFALKRWKEHEQEQLKLLAEKKQGDQLYSETEQELQLLQTNEQRIQARLEELLQEASASGGEELRIHQREQEERKKLMEEQTLLESSLETLLSRSLLASYTELLETRGEEDIALQMASLQDQLTDTARETNELREVVGKLTGQIEKLEQGAEHADHLLQAEAYRATIRQQVDQYAAASFASLLMKKARDVYEHERQPGVLLRASDYFAKMTNGAFTHVKAPFGEQRLVAIRANGESLDTSQLSRGTAEQLYLSMRFALAQEYAGKAILPLVMDDILVNFDEDRMESCLRVLADVSSRHQVLLFTCHGHVRDAAARVIPGNRLIRL